MGRRHLFGIMLLAAVLAFLLTPAGSAAGGADLAGIWQGTLTYSGQEIMLVLRVTLKADGTYGAKLDVPGQGYTNIPVSKVALQGETVRAEIGLIGGSFTGRISPDGGEIAGEWRQGSTTLPLIFRRADRAPVPRRPQEPQKPYPYGEEEVTYENQTAGIKLAGTLTLPAGQGPFPAAILISGSGAQDRDESLFGHRPFLVLADYLTRRGLAVLRVDDRGVGGSTGDNLRATDTDLAADVEAGVAYLAGRREIDPGRIGLIGHSEGGLIAPLAAVACRDVAFLVLLAAPGLPGEDLLYLQTEAILRAGGASEEGIARERRLQSELFAVVKEEKDDAAAAPRLRAILEGYFAGLPAEERRGLGDVNAFIDGQMKTLLSPWFRFFLTYDPRPALEKVACPVLAIGGEKDLQVPARENLAAIEEALRAGRAPEITIQSLPGLNHLFQTSTTGAPAEYGAIEETFSPQALQIIGDWLVRIIAR